MNYFFVGIGGAIGALLRYFMSELIPYNGGFPQATCITNILGSFFLAFLLTKQSFIKNAHAKLLLTTGLLGAFTTFSTFSYETFTLIQASNLTAFLYIFISIIGGLSASIFGMLLAKGGRL